MFLSLVASCLLVSKTLGLPQDPASETNSVSPIPGYGITEIEWSVQAHPDGPFLTLNGTLEEVVAQLRKENPNFDDDFALGSENFQPQKRQETEWLGSGYNCWTFGVCNRSPVLGGSEYLKGLSGQPSNGPGPGNCGRVSCSYGSAIYWCNDNPETYTLNSFSEIAYGADYIMNHCQQGPQVVPGQTDFKTGGQVFNKNNWNVIVRPDNC